MRAHLAVLVAMHHRSAGVYSAGEKISVATPKAGLSYIGEGSEAELPAIAAAIAQEVLGTKGMPMETIAHALRSGALCGLELVGYPLHSGLGKPQPLEGAAAVE